MTIVSSKPTITRKELEGVLDCLIHDELDKGAIVKNFENRLTELTGFKYVLAVNSLVAAYHLAYRAIEINAESEVIIPSFFDAAPLSALTLSGGTPVLADNDADSYNPGLGQIKEHITEKTKAIVTGHMFGFPADLSGFSDMNIPVIEDISHIIGNESTHGTMPFQSAVCVASFASSMMITTGNGGAVMTNNSRWYSMMKDLRGNNGKTPTISFDYSMTDLQGAMGISQMSKLQSLVKRRREIAKIYYTALRLTPHKTYYSYSDDFSFQSFPLIFDAPQERVEKYWKKAGIELIKPISTPLHMYIGEKGMDYPMSDRLSKKLHSLPLYPTLTKREIEKISRTLSNFV